MCERDKKGEDRREGGKVAFMCKGDIGKKGSGVPIWMRVEEKGVQELDARIARADAQILL